MGYGQLIKAMRTQRGLTQEQFAKACGMATITIRQYESEKRTPSYEQILRITTALNITIEEFLQLRPVVDTPENRASIEAGLIAMFETRDAFHADHLKEELNSIFATLNLEGKEEALEAVQAIASNPDYRYDTSSTGTEKPSDGQ